MIPRNRLAEAVDLALAGKWAESHSIVQEDEDGDVACWIHAVLHHQEGDLPNARYWYARCSRKLRESVSPEDELREIRSALKG
jgi:hypothetical protein